MYIAFVFFSLPRRNHGPNNFQPLHQALGEEGDAHSHGFVELIKTFKRVLVRVSWFWMPGHGNPHMQVEPCIPPLEPLSSLVGLDAAGKTTILYKLKLGEIVTTIPTIGS